MRQICRTREKRLASSLVVRLRISKLCVQETQHKYQHLSKKSLILQTLRNHRRCHIGRSHRPANSEELAAILLRWSASDEPLLIPAAVSGARGTSLLGLPV